MSIVSFLLIEAQAPLYAMWAQYFTNQSDLISFRFSNFETTTHRLACSIDKRQLETYSSSSAFCKICWKKKCERFIHKSHFVGILASVNQPGKQSTWMTTANWRTGRNSKIRRKISAVNEKKISRVMIRIEEAWNIIDGSLSPLATSHTPRICYILSPLSSSSWSLSCRHRQGGE